MTEKVLFLTGRLAEASLNKVLEQLAPLPFDWRVHQLGLSVAAFMTDKMIRRRLKPEHFAGYDRIIVPGLCGGDLDALSNELGVPVIRGPKELKDLPAFFDREQKPVDLSKYDVTLFAEIVNAPKLSVEKIVERGKYYAENGANVIDIGFLPGADFPHLEEAVSGLHESGLKVSVDSGNVKHLRRASKAGADYLLSLTEKTCYLAEEIEATAILLPEKRGSLASLERAMELMDKINRPWIADPILDPIHIGLTNSIVRYHKLRHKYPDAPMMMGVGNVTELTDADTNGINALLFGIISELRITNVLTTEVSCHAKKALKEADIARRMMFVARENDSLPRGFTDDLIVVHDRDPFPDNYKEIADLASKIKDANYRIRVSDEGIYMFNRDGVMHAVDPFAFYLQAKDALKDDTGHAFYLGVELARAQIGWQLGKRYTQDEMLKWGCAVAKELVEKTITGATFPSKK